MAREKAKPTEQRDDDEAQTGMEPPADTDTAVTTPAGQPAGVEVSPPIHTRDRDPAAREAWKRERAKQLGHHR